jgi:Holliday junction resolvase|tara:strand:- start:1234 stop:1536 length:303 start_codon:yes stop_codon:yes gene_type:complete
MAMTPEKKVKNKVVQILKQYGAYYFFPATYGYGRSGVPDVICCYRGHFIGIECKAGSNVPTAIQERELQSIEVAGGTALVIHDTNLLALTETLDLLRTTL